VPVLAMVAEPAEAVERRARLLAERLGGEVVSTRSRVGGGAVPLLELDSWACALDGGDALAEQLRGLDPPVIALVREGRALLDCRTLSEQDCRTITL
jgi:L-seryl-tRNA(Ser) seleniumtransferase